MLGMILNTGKPPMNKLSFSIIKLIRFEFWPTWALYWPVFIYGLWLIIKSRSFTFFTSANPLMELGGLVGESKSSILKTIPEEYLPTTIFIDEILPLNNILRLMEAHQLQFPIIIKPDIGERGRGVAKIHSAPELESYLKQNQTKLILQSFIEFPIELGILYYRFPDGTQSGITSVVAKTFLTVTGNGKDDLDTLIRASMRANLQLDYLLQKFSTRLGEIISDKETIMLEPIGNHCRGTTFHNANHLINNQLVKVFDNLTKDMKGFYIGRFDLKVTSIPDLYLGKHIQIMELNGVASEPAHIYDPDTSLYQAYKALLHHWKLVYKIAKQNRKRGYVDASFRQLFMALKR